MKVRKGDTVMVIAGKEKGRSGRVDRVLNKQDMVVVEGLNMIIRHMRPRPDLRQAGRIQKESPIHMSNVLLVCNKCNSPTRPRLNYIEGGRKVRECRQCNETID
jgi:large subunit ribosomal protein L24